MSIVNEETVFEDFPCTVEVLERTDGEMVEAWKIIQIEIENFERMTPEELRNLGHWLVKQGKRIGKEYTSKGARKNG